MRRTVPEPATVAAASRSRASLVAISLATLLVLAWALPAPVAAQQETTARATGETTAAAEGKEDPGKQEQGVQAGAQQAGEATQGGNDQASARAAEPLQDAAVTVVPGDGDPIDRIEIAAADCVVDKGATVTVMDGNNQKQTFSNIGDVVAEGASSIEATEDQVIVTEIEDDLESRIGTSKTGEVIDSSGITCGRDANEAAEDAGAENDANNIKDADDLEELDCDELLVLFRSEEQYGDASGFADSQVRAQVEVCLEEEIVKGTAADEDLPDTGGLSLVALAVLGVATAGAGLAVVRGGRR